MTDRKPIRRSPRAPANSAPTLDDVARAAGVSTATVSRCLNAPDRVVPATREKVMQSVKALGYTPNFAARVMAAKRTHTIGAIIPTMENAIFARGLQAFQEALRNRGYTLLVSSSMYDPEVEKEQIRALVARGADGLLLIGHTREAQIYDYLEQQNMPVLVAWSYIEEARLPSVGFDNFGAMRALTEHILSLGHRRIGMISGLRAGNDRADRRIKGVQAALAQGGLDPAALMLRETPYEVESATLSITSLMGEPAPPTAVICGSDVLAVGALRGAQAMGIDVPGQLSITGFDDMELSRIVTPPLTTVHVPHREMGRSAAEELIEMVEGKRPGRSKRLDTYIVSRGTLTPPAG
ncbi:LacI family DNA-binding transcriptional regulator [Alphaproteobacteria bacterium KMM 3653]|uniref:LacI family DNA-binding transcriptional regulator n=1 Tax=Harenicola maris TaxID=2841044 RepID=A0AAP2G737_9RHOB|nr:LacI family DNA-binding transcriptional regulator [Harenicola maris]